MLQPFELFKVAYIERLTGLKKRYLVSQAYPRGYNHFADEQKTNILLSDYDILGGANIHLNAVKHDKYAAILDLEKPAHKKKLAEMLEPDSKYRVFWAVVKSKKELEERINLRYKENLRRYIEKHTNWRIDRDSTIKPSVQVTFGELFIILKYASQTLRIKFEDIEKV
jgi:hypothetical protein